MTAEQGSSMAWASVAATLESQALPVFADLGRIHTGSPSMPIAAAADALSRCAAATWPRSST